MAIAMPAIDYDWGLALTEEAAVHEVQFEGHYSARSFVGPNQFRQVWSLGWTLLTEAEKETLRTAFKASGGVNCISWQPPSEASALLFVALEPRYRWSGYNQWDVQVTMSQRFDEEA